MSAALRRTPSQHWNTWARRLGSLRRASVWALAACGLSLFFVVSSRALIGSPFLAVRRIEVRAEGRLDRRAILQWVGIRSSASLLTLQLREIRRRLEAHPWVERAWVARAFPHTLRIRIRERQPVGRVEVDQETYLLDDQGELFARVDRAAAAAWVPLVGLRATDLQSRPEACSRLLQEAVGLLNHVKGDPRWRISRVFLDLEEGLRLALDEGPPDIRFGFGEIKKRADRLEKILRHLRREGRRDEVQWIDLRYPRRAIVKFKG